MTGRETDERDLAMLVALRQGASIVATAAAARLPTPEAVRVLHRIRDADLRHDPTAAPFWLSHPLTKVSRA